MTKPNPDFDNPRSGDDVILGSIDASQSLKNSVVTGAKWATMAKLGTQGLQFAVGLVLARLLTPQDFGLLASIYVVTGFAVMFFELGLTAALIHAPNPTERDMSTVFWVNALSGLVYAALMWAASPLVASFFDAPRLVSLMPFVALSFTLSLGVVHNALLQRELKFRRVAVVQLWAAGLGQAATLGAALAGWGAHALVVGPLVIGTVTTVMMFRSVRWRPTYFIDRGSVRKLWSFSGGLLGFNVVNYWGRNADNLIIGRFLGASPLGLYARAYNLMLLPVTQVTGSLGSVMFPALSAIQHDHARVRRVYLSTLGMINFLTIPALVGIAAVSDGLVPLLWGSQWTPLVPVLQVLCIAGVPQCVTTTNGWLFQSQGKTTLMFLLNLATSAFGVCAMVVGLHWGVIGVAWGVLIRSWLVTPVSLHYAGKVVGLRAYETMRNAAATVTNALVMGACVWLLPLLVGWDRSDPHVVLVQVVLGAALYLALAKLLEADKLQQVRSMASRQRG